MWVALSASKALSNVPGGRLADRVGRERALVVAWLLYALAALATGASLFVVAYGAYHGLAEGAERAILAARAPPATRGRAFAALHALTGFAVLPANVLFALLYRADARLAFGASAACAAAAALALATAPRPPTR